MKFIAESNDTKYTIGIIENLGVTPGLSSDGKMIDWNPYEAVYSDVDENGEGKGYIMSPATVLEHEFKHGYDYNKNPIQFGIDKGVLDPKTGRRFADGHRRYTDGQGGGYNYLVERRAIEAETITAKANGELLPNQQGRTKYRWTPSVMVSGPIYNNAEGAKNKNKYWRNK